VTLVLLAGLLTAVLAWIATGRALAAAVRHRALAVPNERSSHSLPTPTGGGCGLGAAAVVVLTAAALHSGVVALGVAAGAVAVACATGLRDDVRPLRPDTKALLTLAAAAALAVTGPLHVVDVPGVGEVPLGPLAVPLTVFWLAGFANLFNFMDGIDGIASLTAAVSGAAFAVAGVRAADPALAAVGAVTSGAAVGFLPWNFPRARIFMGDAGSLPLGLLLAYAAVLAHVSGALPFPGSVLLLGPFVFDTTFTLVRRAARGERLWEAHREHLYQRLSRLWGGHPRVSLLYAGFALVTAALALVYPDLGDAGRGLSLGAPLVAMLAFALVVLVADRKGSSTPPADGPAGRVQT